MKKVKGFSYDTEKDKDIIDHIDDQPNGSKYIWNLVRKDIDNNQYKIKEIIKEEITKQLNNYNLESNRNRKKETIEKEKNTIDTQAITDILNM